MRPLFYIILGTGAVLCASAAAQDYFPQPIPPADFSFQVQDFAVIPDSSPGVPPRLSLLTSDPLDRLFANDQRGPLYFVDTAGGEVTQYLDLRDYPELALRSTSEAGFQSFAFHPDFAVAGSAGFGRFYTIHSSSNTATTPDFDPGGSTNFHTLLLEWNTQWPAASTFTPANASRPYREILRLKQPFGNHNAGLIAFNPTTEVTGVDYGNLYVAVGDGGGGGDPQDNGQDTANPFGALLRIDPLGDDGLNGQYGVVMENQLASDGDPTTLGEIFAYGLRNPQRFGWDTADGNMYIADIGQSAVEEINLGGNGFNFGWDDREGSFAFDSNQVAGMIDPVAEYDHTRVVTDPPTSIGNRAVTVGEVARDSGSIELDGHLLLGDFPTGLIFLLDVDNDPLQGGQDGLRELKLLDETRQPVRLLELINQTRADRGLSATTRADLRFGFDTPGNVFITNKHDGIVRRLITRPGDFNYDGVLDIVDIDTLSRQSAVGNTDRFYDLNHDSFVNQDDVAFWIHDLYGSWLGDANLNGEFDSNDLIDVLAFGAYETAIDATWSTGDFNGSGRFDSQDLLDALADGGYEQGPRPLDVPEPSAMFLLQLAIATGILLRRCADPMSATFPWSCISLKCELRHKSKSLS